MEEGPQLHDRTTPPVPPCDLTQGLFSCIASTPRRSSTVFNLPVGHTSRAALLRRTAVVQTVVVMRLYIWLKVCPYVCVRGMCACVCGVMWNYVSFQCHSLFFAHFNKLWLQKQWIKTRLGLKKNNTYEKAQPQFFLWEKKEATSRYHYLHSYTHSFQ